MLKSSYFSLLFLIGIAFSANCQDVNEKPVKISGVVINVVDLTPVTYASIQIQGSSHGTFSDDEGFFTLLAAEKDTLIFTEVGFKPTMYVIPEGLGEGNYSLIEVMQPDTIILEEIIVFPWPSEREFKRAFLDLDMDEKDPFASPRVARENHQSVIRNDQQTFRYFESPMRDARLYETTGMIPGNNILNPKRWSRFVQDIRDGYYKQNPNMEFPTRDDFRRPKPEESKN